MSESPVNHTDSKALIEKLLFSADCVLPVDSAARLRCVRGERWPLCMCWQDQRWRKGSLLDSRPN